MMDILVRWDLGVVVVDVEIVELFDCVVWCEVVEFEQWLYFDFVVEFGVEWCGELVCLFECFVV